MIKASMVCTNCKKEKDIPVDKLAEFVELDKRDELNLCSACQVAWSNELVILRKEHEDKFAALQVQFGIKPHQ